MSCFGLIKGGRPSAVRAAAVLGAVALAVDGGRTWWAFALGADAAYQASGDPAVAFDDGGHAYYGTLGFRFVGPANAQNPDVLVANSGDSGRTWRVSRVAAGSGNETSVGD